MDKPAFSVPDESKALTQNVASSILQALSSGKYDALFKDAPDKPSDLYQAAQIPPAIPGVRLQNSAPFQPATVILPKYPALDRVAHVEGSVSFEIEVDGNGGVRSIAFQSGNPLLRGAVQDAVSRWSFPEAAFNNHIEATIAFALNCPPQQPSRP